jgi:hypothetical protein
MPAPPPFFPVNPLILTIRIKDAVNAVMRINY